MQSAGGWPRKVKRRDGRLVTFDVTRIESAVARAAREAAHTEPQLPASVAAAVADAIALRGLTEPVTVEEIQDLSRPSSTPPACQTSLVPTSSTGNVVPSYAPRKRLSASATS